MLKGVDVSHYQSALLNTDALYNRDFIITKATEGMSYVDKYCDKFIQKAKSKNLKWGFYHFARNNDPIAEANFFIKNCSGYFGYGIPVLDIEDNKIADWGLYTYKFCSRVYEQTKVYPIVYISRSNVAKLKTYKTWISNHLGLWVARYRNKAKTYDNIQELGGVDFGTVAIYQFTDCLLINNTNVDGDVAYMTKTAWDKYATGDRKISTSTPQAQTNNDTTNSQNNDAATIENIIAKFRKWLLN